MAFVLDALREHGSRAVRIFPPAAGVLVSFADRIATEVVRRYTSCPCHAPQFSLKPRRFLNMLHHFSRTLALLRTVPYS